VLGRLLILLLIGLSASPSVRADAVPIVFDTDMGNDIDDALALGVLHALQSRGECRLLAVAVTKDEPHAALFCDLVNHFYGRGKIPVGVVRDGKTPQASRYLTETVEKFRDGRPLHPRGLQRAADAPEAAALLRRTLASQKDQSVVVVQVGFSTNLARLLDSPPDDVSPMRGRDLVRAKCRFLSMMAGNFSEPTGEYNVVEDLAAAKKLFAEWPTPVVVSGFEVGRAIHYPATSVERDFAYAANHPLADAYRLYQKMPYDRETWDLTSALYAVRPDRGYFDLSPAGTVEVDDKGITRFIPSPNGSHRFLIVKPEQVARVKEALVQLASQPPSRGPLD
jgi:inosine-uridine nucleoside N-ribohydrolase